MGDARRVAGLVVLSLIAAVDGAGPPIGGVAGRLGRLADSVRDRMLDVVGPDEIVERVDINAVIARVDINDLLDRLDTNRLLDRVDVNRLLDRVEVDPLLERADINRLLDRVDINRLLDRVDIDSLLARADIELLLSRVDVDALLDRVDVNHLLDRVDVALVVDRVDPDPLLARVDVNAVMDRVDVERVVQRAGIPEIVAESTGSVAASTLDLIRRQLLALDVVISRTVMRLLRRDPATVPAGPALLAGDGDPSHTLPQPNAPVTDVAGHYAGPVTRLVAYLLDSAIATTAFTLTAGALSSLLGAVGVPLDDTSPGVLAISAFVLWLFFYWWAGTAIAGRTVGMALVGLRIVSRSGEPLSGRQAVIRVLVLPLSIIVLGLGLVGIVVDRERRGAHDMAAGSTVVYDWGDRRATLPTPLAQWLSRHAAPVVPTR